MQSERNDLLEQQQLGMRDSNEYKRKIVLSVDILNLLSAVPWRTTTLMIIVVLSCQDVVNDVNKSCFIDGNPRDDYR